MSKSPPVGLEQKQSLQQTQRLLMTPQMRQALHLLQLPVLELSALIEQEIERNPALESEEEQIDPDDPLESQIRELPEDNEMACEKSLVFDEKDFEILNRLDEDFKEYIEENASSPVRRTAQDDKLQSFKETSIQAKPSLFEHLMKQALETFETREEQRLAELIIGNLDENGYLATSLEEISLMEGADITQLQQVLHVIQTFEPYGVGASSLAESLLIQLQCHHKENTLAYKIVKDHYEDLLHNRLPQIQKALNSSISDIRKVITKDIARLDLHPGSNHHYQLIPYITADVSIKLEGEKLLVEINDEILPPIRLNPQYFNLLKSDELSKESKDYIRQKITAGKWLLKSLDQRHDTLYKISALLAKKQRGFIISPEGKLFPMTMKSIAEELDLHESTIARAVANKYLACPHGLIPLRSFFTNAYQTSKGKNISSRTVKDILLEILKGEDKQHPWSDDILSSQMKERGITCARRTIAKYRKELNIGSASQRKEFH